MADQIDPNAMAMAKYGTLMGRIAMKVAKAQIGGDCTLEQGAPIVSRNITEVSEMIIKKFSGTLGLGDLMAVLATIAGQHIVLNAQQGNKITMEMIPEAADIFYGGILHSLKANKVVLEVKKIIQA